MEKHQNKYGIIRQKLPDMRNKKICPFSQKKIASIFATTGNIFPKICFEFRYRVTGIIKPNDGGILRHYLHDNRRIDKIRKIYLM